MVRCIEDPEQLYLRNIIIIIPSLIFYHKFVITLLAQATIIMMFLFYVKPLITAIIEYDDSSL